MRKIKIDGFPNYELSENGEIKNIKTGKILKPSIGNHGYFYVIVSNNNIRKALSIHRQLGIYFIPNPNNYRCTNHKDGNKLNNDLSNLEWCTHSHNNIHALKHKLRRPCRKIVVNMETGIFYDGVLDAVSSLPHKKPYHYLHMRLKGKVVNRTNLKYA